MMNVKIRNNLEEGLFFETSALGLKIGHDSSANRASWKGGSNR